MIACVRFSNGSTRAPIVNHLDWLAADGFIFKTLADYLYSSNVLSPNWAVPRYLNPSTILTPSISIGYSTGSTSLISCPYRGAPSYRIPGYSRYRAMAQICAPFILIVALESPTTGFLRLLWVALCWTSLVFTDATLSDIGLKILAKSCSALKDVNLSHCSLISDHGIKAISNGCSRLRAVRITNCQNITGVGFQRCCQTLSYLEADSCKLEPEGILEIVSGGGLEYLNVSSLSWCIRGDIGSNRRGVRHSA